MGKGEIENVIRSVERFKEGSKRFGVEKVIIFGSAARGEMNEDSDIDIMVVSRKYGRKHTFKITPKLYEIWHEKERIDYPVDIILISTEEFNELKEKVSIVSEALREGIVV